MLPLEYRPAQEYISLYNRSLDENAKITADAAAVLSERIYRRYGSNITLVSLARAGTPAGIIIKRYLNRRYPEINVSHYTISIIRGRGIDANAMKYILARHEASSICFVDGWTGKGAILDTLRRELASYEGVPDELAVLADPAHITDLCGTREDFLIPSSCLNATVSGLMSRTFLRSDIIGENDFHGAVYYSEMESEDRSNEFIDRVTDMIDFTKSYETCDESPADHAGFEEVVRIKNDFRVSDINFVKPGIGETTRVLLRRIPWKILVSDKKDKRHLEHILELAREKNVEIQEYPLGCYRSCGIIKNLSDI